MSVYKKKNGCYGVSYYDSSAEIIYCGMVKDLADINQCFIIRI